VLLDLPASSSSPSSSLQDLAEMFPCTDCAFSTDDRDLLRHHVDVKVRGF
jgi:hypothetical protein